MNNISKCIGIISWLPDDETRKIRQGRLEKLLHRCDELFNLPIMIIAQNWGRDVKTNPNCVVFEYDKLGITGARKKLRERFLESNYDYIIMLDDDSDITGNVTAAKSYLQQIDEHQGSMGIFKAALLKLLAVPKDLMQYIEYDDIEAERGEGFEDMIFIEKFKKKFPKNHFNFAKNGLDDVSNSGNDKYSTWWKHQYIKKQMGERSREIIEKFKG
jgi:hypothetical protein